LDGKKQVALGIFFATYMRENRGSVEVTLRQGEVSASKTFDFAQLEDNQYAYLPFDGEAFQPGPAKLFLTGAKGKVGSSVTAWARPLQEGTDLVHNGYATNLSLVTHYYWRYAGSKYLTCLPSKGLWLQVLFCSVFVIPALIAVGLGVFVAFISPVKTA